jgi:PAS domain S-box-containing protein
MDEKMRKSGIDIIGDLPWGSHFCQFYQTKEDLMDILVPYFKAGLENNEFCLWFTLYPVEVEETKEALKRAVPDFDVYLEKGQIEIIPCTYWCAKEGVFNPERVLNGWVEKLNQALASGYEGLRMAGNTSWMKKGDWDDFVNYEKKIDRIIGKYQMISLCTYSLDMCKATEITEVVSNHQFSLIKKEGKWERIENVGRENITEHKRTEETLLQGEQRVGTKLENSPSPSKEMTNLELADIIDAQAIQFLMDDFYKLSHIPIGIIDIKGNVLVGVGWQDICTEFHRVHPETCKHCLESDTKLSTGVLPGKFKPYKCKNNMWDIATPIIVGGQHVGNIFLGQFFYEGETLDYELFRSQARQYGFNEEEYIAALEKVPRLCREVVDTIMAFFMKLANMLSQLGYSNIKLAQSLAERDALMDTLRGSEEKYRNIVETANEGIWCLDAEARTTYINEKMAEMLGYSQEEMIDRFILDFTDEESEPILKLHLEKRRRGINEVYELKLICKDGSPLWALISVKSLFDKGGKFAGSLGMFTDITMRKQEEHRICRYNRILEGINWIFSNVVQAKTEEELGNACLSVALEVTGSQFGFINEMGADGLLHDIAKSELGWEQCLMYDKTGHRRPPSDFVVHGLYGSVIINEKSFFANDPQSHPDSIGVPPGHPALTSFLGVPLVQNGKTVGLIAVANRERGYSCEQQEDLEAIAPAVTQALQRKKTEEALRLSNIYNRSLIEASLDPLVTIGHEGKITDANGATEQVTGYSRNELIGTDFSDYFTEPEKASTGYQQVFEHGEVRDYPLDIHHKDGHITPVLYNASVYRDENGEVIGVFAAARDITERKKTEEALKKAHDSLE